MEITITIKIGEKSIDLTMAEATELHLLLDGLFVKGAPSPFPGPYPQDGYPPMVTYRSDTGTNPTEHLGDTVSLEKSSADLSEQARYYQLIYAVSKKYPGESRHDTALRYITQMDGGISPAEHLGGTVSNCRPERTVISRAK